MTCCDLMRLIFLCVIGMWNGCMRWLCGKSDSGSVQGSAGSALVTSDTWCVSAAYKDTVVSIRSFKSKSNNPFPVSWMGMVFPIFDAKMVFLLVSMMAPTARSRVLDKRKGVEPGTTAIFNHKPWMGIASACSLSNVP